jgi:hypothetical protein
MRSQTSDPPETNASLAGSRPPAEHLDKALHEHADDALSFADTSFDYVL